MRIVYRIAAHRDVPKCLSIHRQCGAGNDGGDTPLHLAAAEGQVEIIEIVSAACAMAPATQCLPGRARGRALTETAHRADSCWPPVQR